MWTSPVSIRADQQHYHILSWHFPLCNPPYQSTAGAVLLFPRSFCLFGTAEVRLENQRSQGAKEQTRDIWENIAISNFTILITFCIVLLLSTLQNTQTVTYIQKTVISCYGFTRSVYNVQVTSNWSTNPLTKINNCIWHRKMLHYLLCFWPWRLNTMSFGINRDSFQLLLEQQQAAVHNPHNQMWRLG